MKIMIIITKAIITIIALIKIIIKIIMIRSKNNN